MKKQLPCPTFSALIFSLSCGSQTLLAVNNSHNIISEPAPELIFKLLLFNILTPVAVWNCSLTQICVFFSAATTQIALDDNFVLPGCCVIFCCLKTLGDHSCFYLSWKNGKSQIKLSGNCFPKTASFLPACDQFIITPEEKEIMHS